MWVDVDESELTLAAVCKYLMDPGEFKYNPFEAKENCKYLIIDGIFLALCTVCIKLLAYYLSPRFPNLLCLESFSQSYS